MYLIGIELGYLILGTLLGLLIAQILSCFGYDDIFVNDMKSYFNNGKICKKHFYTMFAIAGFLGGLINVVLDIISGTGGM